MAEKPLDATMQRLRVSDFYETYTPGIESAEILVDCRPKAFMHGQLRNAKWSAGEHKTLQVGRIVRKPGHSHCVELFTKAKWSPYRILEHIIEKEPHMHIFPVERYESEDNAKQAAISYALENAVRVCGDWLFLYNNAGPEVTECH